MRRLIVVLVLVAGCGSGAQPAPESVTTALTRVDRHVAAHDYLAARTALEDLVRRTNAARDTGALDDERADRITAAAARLAAALPAPTVKPTPTPTPSPERGKDDGDRDGEKGGKGNGKKDKDDD